jgi:hypothetical protein
MLQPRELAAAQGFPEDYDFAGNKTETTEQIGNAVPVNLFKTLVTKVFTGDEPVSRRSLQITRPPLMTKSDTSCVQNCSTLRERLWDTQFRLRLSHAYTITRPAFRTHHLTSFVSRLV